MQAKERVISDFDGTVTNVEEEAKPFVRAFRSGVAKILRLRPQEYSSYARSAKSEVTHDPQHHAWVHKGVRVAPATSDPYILETVASQLVITRLKKLGHLRADESFEDELRKVYKEAYKKTLTVPRPDAKEYLRMLRDKFKGVIVTNSDPAIVLGKIEHIMGENHRISVVGNAQKYFVDPQRLHETITLRGLPRPVYTARPFYETVLKNVGPVDMVVGDIYELDLSVPDILGKQIVQIRSRQTPGWETAYMRQHPRGVTYTTLKEIMTHLGG